MDGSAYAVAARIGRVKPRVAGHATARESGDPAAAPATDDLVWVTDRAPTPTADPPAIDDDVYDRWSAIRDRWSQLTFYLFDAEGWR